MGATARQSKLWSWRGSWWWHYGSTVKSKFYVVLYFSCMCKLKLTCNLSIRINLALFIDLQMIVLFFYILFEEEIMIITPWKRALVMIHFLLILLSWLMAILMTLKWMFVIQITLREHIIQVEVWHHINATMCSSSQYDWLSHVIQVVGQFWRSNGGGPEMAGAEDDGSFQFPFLCLTAFSKCG